MSRVAAAIVLLASAAAGCDGAEQNPIDVWRREVGWTVDLFEQ